MLDGMTQQDLADRVGVTRQTILSIERGRYNPSMGLALLLAEVFSFPVILSVDRTARDLRIASDLA